MSIEASSGDIGELHADGSARRLRPEKLRVRFLPGTTPEGPIFSRCYTLTHSDATGDLFLTIGPQYDREQISGWYTRLMRDEVLERLGDLPVYRTDEHGAVEVVSDGVQVWVETER